MEHHPHGAPYGCPVLSSNRPVTGTGTAMSTSRDVGRGWRWPAVLVAGLLECRCGGGAGRPELALELSRCFPPLAASICPPPVAGRLRVLLASAGHGTITGDWSRRNPPP